MMGRADGCSDATRGGVRVGFFMDRLTAARSALALAVVLLSAVVLAGWAMDFGTLKTVFPGMTTMKANTAVGFASGGIGILGLGTRRSFRRVLSVTGACVLGGLGLATLVEYGAGTSLGLDEFLVLDPATTSLPFNGRMSPVTALGFVAGGISLGLLTLGRGTRAVTVAHLLAAVPAAVGLLSLAGYAYGVERLYHLGPYVAVALHTGVGLELLAAAILLTRQDEGWGRPFVDRPVAAGVLLQITLLSIAVPFGTGLLVVWGIRAGFYEAQFAPALLAVAASGALVWLAFRSARILSAAEGALILARAEARSGGEQLERSRRRHVALIEELPQLVWTCLPNGECDYLSRQWVEYTGVGEAEQLGFGWLLAIHPEDGQRTDTHWRGAARGEHPYDIEFRLRGAGGGYRWFKARGTPIRGEGGGIAYWFGTCTDIEDIVAARDLIARSKRELEEEVAARAAELMLVEAQLRQAQKMEAVGQLTGGLAHDFNNLLAAIMGSLELLQTRVAQGRVGEVGRYIDAAQGAARRAAALTHRLLAFSRRQTLAPVPTDVNRLVAGMDDLIRRTIGPQVAMERVAAGGLWSTLVDPSQLESALLNLCINGRDAMPGGGRLGIETANLRLDGPAARERDLPPGEYVALRVSDSGCGMPPEVAARAFDPFFTTKPIGQGTGLGLSMIYGFARQSGGQVRIHSAVGRGTTVCLLLPRHAGEAEDTGEAEDAPAAALSSGRGASVLVVDDEPTVRLLVGEVLQDLGCDTSEAGDGAEALRVLQSDARVDLLVTDVGLPGGMNGRQVADAARVARPGLKVLFITGYAESSVLSHGHLEPGMHVLTKPFAMEALAGRVRELLAQ
ncbi:MAG: ATP-binding protein [Janthinobacterium lividum]